MKYYITSGYLGKRLFRYDEGRGVVLQIVVESGEKRRGRPNMVGIYYIKENTLKGNYLWHCKVPASDGCVMPTTKKLFDYWFTQMLKQMITL